MKKERNRNIHLNRQELFRAARGDAESFNHLEDCRECREMVQLLKAYQVAGRVPLTDAPAAFINRAVAIAQKDRPIKRVKRQFAKLIFDSWLVPHPVGVRGTESLDHRRIRFEARDITVDLRAEHMPEAWVFVAQMTGADPSKTMMMPGPGRKPVFADETGLFLWTSKRPPQKLSFQLDDALIELPELSWKKPRST